MLSITRQLLELQQQISRRNESHWHAADCERLYFSEISGLFDVEFYGDNLGESFDDFLGLLNRPDVAAAVRSLVVSGPDRGANGAKAWDLSLLLDGSALYSRLVKFYVEPTKPDHHNYSIIASHSSGYEEEGMVARLLARMPVVESLTLPSAPDEVFFLTIAERLKHLRVGSGYDHKNFILNLSRSNFAPVLNFLDFGDYSQNYIENYQEQCTPFEHYVELFKSKPFAGVTYFRLRNPALSQNQILDLRALREDIQFHLVHEIGHYIR